MTNVEVAFAQKPSAVGSAIEAHRVGWSMVQALGDDIDNETLDRASRVESVALVALVNTPCRRPEDLYMKLEYLAQFLLKREGEPSVYDGFGPLAVAITRAAHSA
jgi:hypothetical protein